jgi:hypothetical protein
MPRKARVRSSNWRRLSFFAGQLAVQPVDEVNPGAGFADDGFKAALRIIWSDLVGQPMLHVQTCPRASEDDISHRRH